MCSKSLGIAALLAACSIHALAARRRSARPSSNSPSLGKGHVPNGAGAADEGYKGLVLAAEQAEQAYPGRAEPLIWKAIALSSAAKVEGGLAA